MIEVNNLLATGGAGSVGTILVRRLLQRDPNTVRIFNQSELGLATLKNT